MRVLILSIFLFGSLNVFSQTAKGAVTGKPACGASLDGVNRGNKKKSYDSNTKDITKSNSKKIGG